MASDNEGTAPLLNCLNSSSVALCKSVNACAKITGPRSKWPLDSISKVQSAVGIIQVLYGSHEHATRQSTKIN